MSHRRSLSVLVALAAIAVTAPLQAQVRSTVNTSVLDAAVAARQDNSTSRAVVKNALTSSSALALAAGMGLSPEAINTRIAALDDASAKKVADQMLAGGDSTVVISTTAIIIGLLVLILLTR